MNKQQFQRMREALQTIEFSNRNGSHVDCIRLNNNCSDVHNNKIIELCKEFKKNGIAFMTEAKFRDNLGRADIITLSDHTIYEIMNTESDESILAKQNKYPNIFKIIKVRI